MKVFVPAFANRLPTDWNPEAQHPIADQLFDEIKDPKDRVLTKIMLGSTLLETANKIFYVHMGDLTSIADLIELWGKVIDRYVDSCMDNFFVSKRSTSGKNADRLNWARMLVCLDPFKGKIASNIDTLLESPATAIANMEDPPVFNKRDAESLLSKAVFVWHGYLRAPICKHPTVSEAPHRFLRDWDSYATAEKLEEQEQFKSRMLYLVMEEFSKHISKGANDEVIIIMPEESDVSKRVREMVKKHIVIPWDAYKSASWCF